MFVKLSGPRHTVSEGADGIEIRIPARRNVFLLLFLSVWLVGWAFGEVTAAHTLASSAMRGSGPPAAFLLIWLTGWTVGGGFALYTWLWQLKGCEIVTVSPAALGLKRDVFGFGAKKLYDAAEIRELRVGLGGYNPFDFRTSLAFWGVGGGLIAFDYGYKTYRFAAGVEEAEARIILKMVADRLPRTAAASVV